MKLKMNKSDFFRELGFSEYESKVLSSFSNLQKATAKQISEDSGVPQNKLYQIIKKFESLGLLSQIPGKLKKYELINLQTFINGKIKEKESNLKSLKENSKKIKTLKNSDDEFSFSLIKGQKAIMDKLSEKNIQVKKEILGVQRGWVVWGEGLRQMQTATRKGVKVKLIGVVDSETEKRAREWKEVGCEIRKFNSKFGEFPLRFSIFDNKEARITLGKPEVSKPEDYITIWTSSKPLISLLRKQFEEMWKESEKLK